MTGGNPILGTSISIDSAKVTRFTICGMTPYPVFYLYFMGCRVQSLPDIIETMWILFGYHKDGLWLPSLKK